MPRKHTHPAPYNHTVHTQRTIRTGGPIAQLVALCVLIAVAIVGLALSIIILPIALVLFIILYVYFRIRRALNKAHAPGGIMDERQNVRVIDRHE